MADESTGRRVLVTGSTGFLGRHLLDLLTERNFDVVCLVRKGTDTRILDGRPVSRAAADYSDPASLKRALAGVRYVFHLGAVLGGNDEQEFFCGNVEATQRLSAACLSMAPHPRFIFASSIAAAGPSKHGVGKDETEPCEPGSAYGRSKLLAERALEAVQPELPLVIVRLPNLLGLGQPQLRATMALVRIRIVPILGGRRRRTSICFAQDAARALLLAAESSPGLGEVYYATDGGSYSWQDLVEPLARELAPGPVLRLRTPVLVGIAALIETWARIRGATPSVTVGDILSASRDDWLFDDTRIRRVLGFAPRVAFAAEMARLARAYREGWF